ncbi:MAG: RNA polymerase factor sigma-54 [Bacteroidales bacterium]
MLKQTFSQRLTQRLSPLQIQQIKLLELPVLELEQKVKEELEENPALKEEITEFDILQPSLPEDFQSYRLQDSYPTFDLKDRNNIKPNEIGFHDLMMMQLSLLPMDQRQKDISSFIIGCLDADGYLRRPIASLIDDFAFVEGVIVSEEEIKDAIVRVQDLEPAGIGARSLQECLWLQLNSKLNDEDIDDEEFAILELAIKIVKFFFEDFSNKRHEKIATGLSLSEQELREAMAEILKLNPKPGNSFSEQTEDIAPSITPDFLVEYKDGELISSLTARNAPQLSINQEYKTLLKQYAKDKEAMQFVRKKIDDAGWFINAIKSRYLTLSAVMNVLIEKQKSFFTTGDEASLKPLMLKDIASIVGYDVSTISRVVNSKYVQTNFGIFSLKFFFSEATQTETGENISTRKVKQEIKELIANENKHQPLSDEDISEILQKKTYKIARRTVAKYRQMLEIPEARMRRSI